jgi:hypothetical protein
MAPYADFKLWVFLREFFWIEVEDSEAQRVLGNINST